ncbi:MAG TPA: NAD(P)H-dependent glycerol-3-phosphate dehydrogenase, partial [Phycisphaerae bacterium]|nr:NAD(P)H-dependent glycerol-3-phosphate dehydrogenase [Phycisphaerae bacterium]
MKNICVLGDGAWGTAVATLLAHNGYHVKLWCHDAANVQTIARTHINERYLPEHHLSENIIPTASLKDAMCGSQWIFEAIPVQYLRSVIAQAAPYFTDDQVWVILSKGIEQNTLMLPTQIIDDVSGMQHKKAVCAGPSFAADLASKQVTAVSVASTDCALIPELQSMLENEYFRLFPNTDLIGVQVGGALKNVITLGVGMLEGAGYTDNTKAFLVTRGLQEMAVAAKALGGDPETIYGLSGVGDLMLTALGKLSRNLAVGKRLGHGDALQHILDE